MNESGIYLADWTWRINDEFVTAVNVVTPRYPFYYNAMMNTEYLKLRAIRQTPLAKAKIEKLIKTGIPRPYMVEIKENLFAGNINYKLDPMEAEKVYVASCAVWNELIAREMNKEYMKKLVAWIQNERKTVDIYPEAKNTFRAFKLTPFSLVRVVIIGQDPYHTPGVADGLSFSSKKENIPPSLMNIYTEIYNDCYYKNPQNESQQQFFNTADLTHWANQGVLLLNRMLSVSKGLPESHKNKGWEQFNEEVIKKLNQTHKPIVYMLWGKKAQELKSLIEKRNLILEAAHPSPFSVEGFYGCKHFSQANQFLKEYYGSKQIVWANYKGIYQYT